MSRIERQELDCHECGKYVQFDLDVELNGKHVLACPNCGHEHCREVKDGVITDVRWDTRNYVKPPPPKVCNCNAPWGQHTDDCPKHLWQGRLMRGPSPILVLNGTPVYWINAGLTNWTNNSTYTTYQGTTTTGNVFLYQAWMNTTANAS